jgi:hypothetical protein
MTAGEMIEALKRFDPTDLIVIENDEGDFMPLADRLERIRMGVDGEHYNCLAVSFDAWPGEINYAIPKEDDVS